MDSEMVTYLIIGLVLGVIIGVILTNVLSPKSRKYNQVKHDLEDAKKELVAQKQMIVKHFSHSAEILDNMAKEFRRLYQHMVENSNNLISQEDLDALKVDPSIIITNKEHINTENKDQPKDYSGNPSGLLKSEETKP
ncbi:YhcB family protein [Orbus mooreae]|uniref:YhcB family protein n=1 Tax=Orbus mooreae TaxID=3074107 RepID=UPI00370DBE61